MTSRILPIFALMLALAGFLLYVSPAWSGPIQEAKSTIANNKRILAAAEEFEKRKNDLAAARNEIDPENLKRLEILLPDSVNNVGLILDLNALAARSGISLSNIDIQSTSDQSGGAGAYDASLGAARPDPVSSVDLSVTAVGTYPALQAFLSGIEKSARLLDVNDLTVRGSETGVYTYQMVVRLYWLR